jgi:hypothetical protein
MFMGWFVYRVIYYLLYSSTKLDRLLDEMKKYVEEIEMLDIDKRMRNFTLKKHYIHTNMLVNKFRLGVYEKLLEK